MLWPKAPPSAEPIVVRLDTHGGHARREPADRQSDLLAPVSVHSVMPVTRASTPNLSTGTWSEFNQRPEGKASAVTRRGITGASVHVRRRRPLERLGQPLRGLVQLVRSASGRLCWSCSISCCCCGVAGRAAIASQRLDRVLQLLGALGEDQRRVVDGLHPQVFVIRLVEWAEDERVGVDLLDELVRPVGGVADVRDRSLDLGAAACQDARRPGRRSGRPGRARARRGRAIVSRPSSSFSTLGRSLATMSVDRGRSGRGPRPASA